MRFLCLAIVSTLLLWVSGGRLLAQESVRVGFYNLHNLYDTINDPGVSDSEFLDYDYRLKIKELSAAINLFSPDILGVCELENYAIFEQLSKSFGDRYNIVHYDSRDARGIDVALLYSQAYFELLSSELMEFDYLSRGVLRADFRVRSSSELFTVLVAHLPSQRGGKSAKLKRNRALDALDSLAQELNSVILIGDMNDNPTDMRYLYNCALKAYSEGLASYVYRDRWSLFDQIMVSLELKARLCGGQRVVVSKELINGSGRFKGYPRRGRPSDHLPVYIDIEL